MLSIAHLEPYKSDSRGHIPEKDLPRLRENPDEYEVLEIVDKKKSRYRKRMRTLYKCRWKDYGVTEDWIPKSYLRNAKEVLDDWETGKTEKKNQT